MKKVFNTAFKMLLLMLFLLPVNSIGNNTPSSSYKPGQLEAIARLTIRALSSHHLRKQVNNTAFSALVFDRYFKQIDPGKVYFTQEDIASFSKDRFRLLIKINSGDLQLIYDIYGRYLERLSEYRSFVENEINKGIRFDVDETFQPDREDLPYCANDAELHELWRKRLKNDLLYYRLMQKVMQERSDDPEVQSEMGKRWFKKTPEDKVRTRIHDLYNMVSQSDKMDILGIFLTAMAQTYGPHSYYSTPKQDEDFDIQFRLSLTGIGATLTSEDGFIKVVDLVPGGPADKDGRLQPEDRIISVTQENGDTLDVIDMSVNNAVKHIRGEAGTKVTLTVLPAAKGASALPVDITITRGKVELKENAAKGEIRETTAVDGKVQRIGVITLNNFYMDFDAAARGEADYRSCTRDIKAILDDFNRRKVDAVVMDLRNNSGGSLLEAINLSGLFITRGPIVQVVDANKRMEVHRDRDRDIAYRGPLVLLVSKFSASSTEILTGAMKDYRRGLVIGDSRTYGKGTVLSVTDLSKMLRYLSPNSQGGSLTHEIAMFYRVNGESNQERGIAPDIVLPSFTEVMEVGEQYNDFYLPWGKVEPLNLSREATSGYRALSDDMIKRLAEASQERFAESPQLRKMLDDIARFKAVRERKTVSLNEAVRLKEYYEEKAAADRMEELAEAGEKTDKKSKQDLLLDEAMTIAAEYSVYQQQEAK